MRRLAAILAAAAALGAAAPAAHAGRSDDGSKPVVFLSGAEQANTDCGKRWELMIARLKTIRIESGGKTLNLKGGFKTVTNYASDSNCDAVLAGDVGTGGLHAQAMDFATWLKANYSSKNQPVDVVAHGTGGLVVRYALAMAAQKTPGWPAPLLVEDAITLSSPHAGSTRLARECTGRQICPELDPESTAGQAMIAKLATTPFQNPQGKGGTDWTLIATTGDAFVTPESALAMDAAHETTFQDPKLTHDDMLHDITESRDAIVTYQHRGTDVVEWRKAPHVAVRVGLNLIYGADGDLGSPTNSPDGCTGSNDTTNGPTIVRNPGLANWVGTGDLSFIKSGILEAYADCFKADGKAFTSTGVVRINGLNLVPAQGETITIDPGTRKVTSKKASISLPAGANAIQLSWAREWEWIVPKEAGALTGSDLDGLKVSGGGKIGGWKLKGSLKLSLGQGSTNLEGTLALPGKFQGKPVNGPAECGDGQDNDDDGKADLLDDNCGDADDNYEDAADNPGFALSMRSDNVAGLRMDKFGGTFEGNVKLGNFTLPSGSLSYSWPDDTWSGSLSATFPLLGQSPKATLAAEVKQWSVRKASVDVDGINKPIGTTGLFLQRLKVGINRDPFFELTIGGAISVGPRIPQVGKAGGAAVEVDGEATAPVGGGRTLSALKFVGKLKVAGEDFGQLTVDYKDGTTTIAGELGRDDTIKKTDKINIKYAVKVGVNGVVDKTGADFAGSGQLCFEGSIKFLGYEREQDRTCLLDSTLRFSSKGKQTAFTACGRIDLGITKHLGWAIKYPADGKPPKMDLITGSCDVDEWHAAPATAAQAIGGAHSLSIGTGLDAAVIGVQGDGGVPHVALRGPGGAVVPAPASASGIVRGDGYALIHSPADNSTYVIVAKPESGRWSVEPQPGSAPIEEVRSADTLPDPSVSAKVTRVRGGKQRVRYLVKRIPGQVVRFREVGGGASAPIGTARGARGTLTFRPAFGRAGVRKIVAEVVQRGAPRAALDVARYRAYAPRPLTAPRGLKLTRKGERMTVTWKPVAGAVRYVVEVETGDGRSMMYEPKGRRVIVKRLFTRTASTVKVRAVRADDKLGPVRSARGGR